MNPLYVSYRNDILKYFHIIVKTKSYTNRYNSVYIMKVKLFNVTLFNFKKYDTISTGL